MKEIKSLRGKREKHFENGDGTITAYMYDEDVHYMCDGVYRQIDNTLEDKGECYENKYNEFKATFSKTNDDLVCVNSHNHYLKMYLLDKNNMILEKDREILKYKDIMDGVDIDYKVISNKVKESIILNNKYNYPTVFNFFIDTDLVLVNDNNRIKANCNDETIFTLDSPYMIDNKKQVNDNIDYIITKVENGYNLTLELDSEWLSSEDREYPVIIDPTIINGDGENDNVYDAFISSDTPNDFIGHTNACLVGNDEYGKNRSLLKFTLPSIDSSYNIVNATIHITGGIPNIINGKENRPIFVHQITTSWSESTATWNNMADKYNKKPETIFYRSTDYNEIKRTKNSFDITNLVKKWYLGEPNNGIMLKWNNETYSENAPYFLFISKDGDLEHGTTDRPFIAITYINQNGIKNYMDYMSLNTNTGIVNVNNYNGNLNSSFYVNKTINNKMPITLTLNYNTHDVLYNTYQSNLLGFKFNYEEKIIKENIDQTDYLKYFSSTNAIFYFYKTDDNVYKDEEGLNFKISYNNDIYELIDNKGNKKIFTKINNVYLLTKIVNIAKNEINIVYANGKISKVIDANKEEVNINYENNLITVKSNYETSKIYLLNNQIGKIETKLEKINFEYNSNKLLSSIKDVNDTKISCEYNSNNKISVIKKYGYNLTLDNSFNFIYGNNVTSIIDKNNRKTVYTFNNVGNVINKALYNNGSSKISDAYVNVSEYGDNDNSNKNKLTSTNNYRRYINNLLMNSGFEEDYTKCNFVFDTSYIEKSIGSKPHISFHDGRRYMMMENNDKIIFDIEEEGDYTLSFDLAYKVHYHTYLNLILYTEKDGVRNTVDGFGMGTSYFEGLFDYRRISFSGHFEANSKLILEHTRSVSGGNYAYISDLQLEKGLVANSRNILSNSNFSKGIENWDLTNSSYEIVTLGTKEKALKINASPDISSEVIKRFRINEEKGRIYEISFWYKNEGLYKDGTKIKLFEEDEEITSNKKLYLNSNNTEWQYFSYSFKTKVDYSNITLRIITKDVNSLYLTNFMAIKDPRSLLYDYDSEGNLILSKNLNKVDTTFKYDKNNQLLSTFTPKGDNYKYEYDNVITDRVLKGISPTGISNEIKYDINGNPVRTIINNVNPDSMLVNNASYRIRLKGSEKYLSCDFKTNLISILEDNCNPQAFKLIKVNDEFYKLQVGYKFLTVFENRIVLTNFDNDNILFKININDNGSYKIIPKIDDNKILGNVNNKLSLVDKTVDNNEFYFEDIETPLFIESKSYYTKDGKFVTCVEDPLGNKTNYDVDKINGLTTSVINPRGHKTIFNYNEKEQVISIVNKNKTINYTYDEHDLLSKIKSGRKEYTFSYNNLGQRLQTKVNDNLLVSNEYDLNTKNLIKSTYGNGHEINYTYDEFDRIKTMNVNSDNYSYFYDDFGSISKILLNNNTYYEYMYDLARRLERIIRGNLSIKYNYDENDNVTSKVYDLIGGEGLTRNIITYEYNKDDNITKVEVDGNIINYNYDYLGRLVNKNINDNLQVSYTYITNGDRTSLIINTYTIGDDTYKYEYDEVYNITKIYLNNDLVNEYEYDVINQLISERNYLSNKKYQYIYDIEGNIVSKKEFSLDTKELLHIDNYEYNNSEWEDQLTKFNEEEISYDVIGNPIMIGNASLTWEGRRLVGYTKGDLNVRYEYNVDGIRTSKIVNGMRYENILEGKNIILEESPNGMIYYIYDSNEVIGFKYNSQTYFYKKNLQGDIVGIYNSGFEQIVTYTYDAWGKVLSVCDNNGNEITDSNHIGLINPFRYRSYYYDQDTKLYYLNSRYYNPEWCRFISCDKLISVISCKANLYNYCDNNSINKIDSDGMIGLGSLIVGSLIVAGVAVVAKIYDNKKKNKKWNENILGTAVGSVVGTVTALMVNPVASSYASSFVESGVNEICSYNKTCSNINGTKVKEKTSDNYLNSVKNVGEDTLVNGTTSSIFKTLYTKLPILGEDYKYYGEIFSYSVYETSASSWTNDYLNNDIKNLISPTYSKVFDFIIDIDYRNIFMFMAN